MDTTEQQRQSRSVAKLSTDRRLARRRRPSTANTRLQAIESSRGSAGAKVQPPTLVERVQSYLEVGRT
jgi:hypothetical protein